MQQLTTSCFGLLLLLLTTACYTTESFFFKKSSRQSSDRRSTVAKRDKNSLVSATSELERQKTGTFVPILTEDAFFFGAQKIGFKASLRTRFKMWFKPREEATGVLWTTEQESLLLNIENPQNNDYIVDNKEWLQMLSASASGIIPEFVAPLIDIKCYPAGAIFVAQRFVQKNHIEIDHPIPPEFEPPLQRFLLEIVTLPLKNPVLERSRLYETLMSVKTNLLTRDSETPTRWFFWMDAAMTHLCLRYSDPSKPNQLLDYFIVDAERALKTWPDKVPWLTAKKPHHTTLAWRRQRASAPCKICELNEYAYHAVFFSRLLVKLQYKMYFPKAAPLKMATIQPKFKTEKFEILRSLMSRIKCEVNILEWQNFSVLSAFHNFHFSAVHVQPLKRKWNDFSRSYRVLFLLSGYKGVRFPCVSCILRSRDPLPFHTRIHRIPFDTHKIMGLSLVHPKAFSKQFFRKRYNVYSLKIRDADDRFLGREFPRKQVDHSVALPHFNTRLPLHMAYKIFKLALEVWSTALPPPLTVGALSRQHQNKFKRTSGTLWSVGKEGLKWHSLETHTTKQVIEDSSSTGMNAIFSTPFIAPVTKVRYFCDRVVFEALSFMRHSLFVNVLDPRLKAAESDQKKAVWETQEFSLNIVTVPLANSDKTVKDLISSLKTLEYTMPFKSLVHPPKWFFWLNADMSQLYLRFPLLVNPRRQFEDHLITDLDTVLQKWLSVRPAADSKTAPAFKKGIKNWRRQCIEGPCPACEVDEGAYAAVVLSRNLFKLFLTQKGSNKRSLSLMPMKPKFIGLRFKTMVALVNANACQVSTQDWFAFSKLKMKEVSVAYIQKLQNSNYARHAESKYRVVFFGRDSKDTKYVSCVLESKNPVPKAFQDHISTSQRVGVLSTTYVRLNEIKNVNKPLETVDNKSTFTIIIENVVVSTPIPRFVI